MRTVIVVLAVFSTLAVGGGRADPQSPKGVERVHELIDQLGSSTFDRREQATKELQAVDPAALPALRQALKSATDPEVVRRVQVLVRKLEEQELTAKLLAPRRLRLVLKEAKVADAVAQLAKTSGYPIHLSEAAAQTDRQVTLDTGETTFWDAFGRLCKEAGLVENESLMGPFDVRSDLPGGDLRDIFLAAPGIHLKAGKPVEVPTVVVGSVRLRLVKAAAAPKEAVDLVLEVSGEPRLCGLEPAGSPQAVRAIDEQEQTLAQGPDDDTPPRPHKQKVCKVLGHRYGGWVLVLLDGTILKGNSFGPAPPVAEGPFLARVRLRQAEKKASSLKELTGRLLIQTNVETEPPVVIDKVLEAAGRSAKAPDGSTLSVERVEQLPNKDVRVQVTWEQATGGKGLGLQDQVGGKMVARGGRMEMGGLEGDRSPATLAGAPRLLGADGASWTLAEWASQGWTVTAAQMTHRLTLVYRPGPGQGKPAQLVWAGRQAFAFAVPFTFRDIPLP
jgi:hypothetical protein